MNRRTFLKTASLAGASAAVLSETVKAGASLSSVGRQASDVRQPMILSTWDFKLPVNQTASRTLQEGGTLLDAVEKAIKIVEEDPRITSVGYGGYPDRDGHVTLDACMMDERGNAGSVVFLEHIMHPISVARLVMEKTPHVMLAGVGALQFALAQGFHKEDLLTEEAKKAYAEWLKKSNYLPPINEQNHDTIGLVAMDASGNLAGGCSTSGAAWKMRGRVGDSPLIGAGLYVDNEIGAATSSGLGEAVIKVAGSFLVVELMRNGKSPAEACRLAIERIIQKQPKYKDVQDFLVGFIAIDKQGEVGAFSYRKGFQYSLLRDGVNNVIDAEYVMK
ncbi:MAG: N(4)-(beta-N-acetylglucosaminyl)-L-asparaginase [Ignavibacteria bacterium]|nr:N(4)-(beta-N-acetylglucosaminyl)-L-asparaginase [Ignavibacteria bacterium]